MCDLLGEGFGQALQGPLGGVVGAQVGEGSDAADGGDLHNVAAALGAQDGQDGLCDGQRAEEVGLELVAYLLFGDLLDRAEQTVSGVVDHHIQSAEVRVGGGDGRVDGVTVGDV